MGGGRTWQFWGGSCRWAGGDAGGDSSGGGQGVNPVRDTVNTSDCERFKVSGRCQQGVNEGVRSKHGGIEDEAAWGFQISYLRCLRAENPRMVWDQTVEAIAGRSQVRMSDIMFDPNLIHSLSGVSLSAIKIKRVDTDSFPGVRPVGLESTGTNLLVKTAWSNSELASLLWHSKTGWESTFKSSTFGRDR